MILLPVWVITESKVGSDSELILKYPVAPDKAMKRLRDNDTFLRNRRRTRRG